MDLMLSMSHIPTRLASGGFSATETVALPTGLWPAQALASLLRPIGVSLDATAFRLPLAPALLEEGLAALPAGDGPMLLLAPAGGPADWPAQRWQGLPDRIRTSLPALRSVVAPPLTPATAAKRAGLVAAADVVLASDQPFEGDQEVTFVATAGNRSGTATLDLIEQSDIQLAFPFILLAIMFLVVLGPGMLNLILVLGIGQWVTYARIVRAQTLSLREKEFVEAARALGDGTPAIIFRTILPNIAAALTVIASFNVASVILAEASLSFLGLGVPPEVPTWGSMLAQSRDQLIANKWWLAIYPGLAIVLTVLSFNIMGDWLRDFLDPRLKEKG
jgi:hypothetical protein